VEETSEISCTEGADTSVRLPTDVKPSHYNIVMDILMESDSTKGSVDISIDVLRPTRQIVLHSHHEDITIKDVNLTYGNNNEKVIPIANTLQDKPRDMLMIVFQDELQPNTEKGKSFTLSITFEGQIVGGQWGLFTAFERTDTDDYMATTQFTPVFARRTFPCFDEPALKATFSITLGREKRFGTVSNTQTSYETARGGDLYWDIFEEKIINQFIHLNNIYLL
jgi:aminopeptidase N